MTDFFEKYRSQLELVCSEHHVGRMYAYGSVLSNDFKERSDVDLIVTFDSEYGKASMFKIFFSLKKSLEKLFGREVDLMVEKPIRNPILREEIERTKHLIYGEESPEMVV